jgi:hypothetical protein
LRKTKAGIWTADRCRDQLARIGIPDPHNQKVTLKLSKDGIRDAIKRARARESRQGRQYGVD